ncbi:MAG: hypothetical protein OEU92_01245 [Alphaproteobacteria bacterium]|nr:hypothetical protein [Alphaproteobacteria bacterium]
MPADKGQDGALAEFVALRQEFEMRTRFAQQLFGLQITIAGAILGFVVAHPEMRGLLLAIPFASFILAGRYRAQYTSNALLGKYVREELSPRVTGGLNWETWLAKQRTQGRFLDWSREAWSIWAIFPGIGVAALVAAMWIALQEKSTLDLPLPGFVLIGILDVLAVAMTWSLVRRLLSISEH